MYIQPPIETIIIMLQGVLYAEPFSWSQQLYHSIHARGENVEDILREGTAAELAENEEIDQSERQSEHDGDPEDNVDAYVDAYVDAGNDDDNEGESKGNMPTTESVLGMEADPDEVSIVWYNIAVKIFPVSCGFCRSWPWWRRLHMHR